MVLKNLCLRYNDGLYPASPGYRHELYLIEINEISDDKVAILMHSISMDPVDGDYRSMDEKKRKNDSWLNNPAKGPYLCYA